MNHCKTFSGLSLGSIVLPTSSAAAQPSSSNVPIGTPVSSQVSTPLSRDSPFFFSDTATPSAPAAVQSSSSSNCLYNASSSSSSAHQRYPSSASADDHRFQRNHQPTPHHHNPNIASQTGTFHSSNMVALDFITNPQSEIRPITMNNRALSYNQMCYAANQQYQSQYSSYNGTQYSVSTTRSHEEDIYEDLCYVTLR